MRISSFSGLVLHEDPTALSRPGFRREKNGESQQQLDANHEGRFGADELA
jgi:hypothetical protein